jgi:hypothetical protein
MRDDTERVRDIREAIVRIEKYSVRGRQVFNDLKENVDRILPEIEN